MRNLSQDEISTARADVKSAEQLAAEALARHTENLRPKIAVAPDMVGRSNDWATDVRPRWNGKLVAPLDSIDYV